MIAEGNHYGSRFAKGKPSFKPVAHIQTGFARQNCGLAWAAKGWMRNVMAIMTFRARRQKAAETQRK